MSFRLQIVREVERGKLNQLAATRRYGIQGRSTVWKWLRKYDHFDWENQNSSSMPKTQEQQILEFEQKVRSLEKQKAFLEVQAAPSNQKTILFDMVIDIAEKEFNILIRKKFSPQQQTAAASKKRNSSFCL